MAFGDAPYATNLDPQLATELTRTGATLLVLRMPECTHFGVDQHAFSVGHKFMGLKMVPPGAHFISYRAVNKEDGSLSPATGFFWWAQPRDVQVRMWDPETETLVHLPDADEAERYAAGVRRFDFDAHLAPYNLHGMRAWWELSNHITAEHVTRISPVSGNISIMAEAHDEDPHMLSPKTEAEKKLASHLAGGRAKRAAKQQKAGGQQGPEQQQQQQQASVPQQQDHQQQEQQQQQCVIMEVDEDDVASVHHGTQGVGQGSHGKDTPGAQSIQGESVMAVDESPSVSQPGGVDAAETEAGGPSSTVVSPTRAGRCFYTPLPRFVRHPGMSPAELTAMNMDKTTLMQQVASKHYGGQWQGLLGELQFAFVAFVFGQSLDGYAQWKALLLLFLGCEHAALHGVQPTFVQVVHVLRVQLEVSLSPDASARNGKQQQQQQQMQKMHPFGVPMVEELLPDSFLRHALGTFFQMLEEHDQAVTPPLFKESTALKQLLKQTLGWEYDVQLLPAQGDGVEEGQAEGDEDGPMIVHNPADMISL